MHSTALVVTLLASSFLPFLIVLFVFLGQSKATQERVRARRRADASMNARLLRFNL
jgi:hypothetical protein